MPKSFSKEFDQVLKEFITLKKQCDKPFTLKKSEIIVNESLFNQIDTNGEEGLQIDEIEAYFSSFKKNDDDYENIAHCERYMMFCKKYGINYQNNAFSVFVMYEEMKKYVENEVQKSKNPVDNDVKFEGNGFVYTKEYDNDIEVYLDGKKDTDNACQKIQIYTKILEAVKNQKISYELKKNYKDFSISKPLELVDILSNNSNYISVGSLKKFFTALKGDNIDNVNFKLDSDCIKSFRKVYGLNDYLKNSQDPKDKISDGDILLVFYMLQKIIMTDVLLGYDAGETESNVYFDYNSIDVNINKLTSDISFDTENKKFNKIFNSFDVGSNEKSLADKNDGKLSSFELKLLWHQIKSQCTVNQNGVTKFDKSKIETYIKVKFPNENITVDDFLSFLDVINLALKNSNSVQLKPEGKLKEANARLDLPYNQAAGDCWLISALYSLTGTDKGKASLEELLNKDSNGNIYVYLPGPKETYVVTPNELKQKSNYAWGDGDIRAIEIAVEKYFANRNNVYSLDGGDGRVSFWLLTGMHYGRDFFNHAYMANEDAIGKDGNTINENKKDKDGNEIKSTKKISYFQSYKNEDLDKIDFEKYAVIFGSNKQTEAYIYAYYENGDVAKKLSGKTEKYGAGHYMVLTNVDKDYVYAIDQRYIDYKTGDMSKAKIKFKRDEFVKTFNILELASFDRTLNVGKKNKSNTQSAEIIAKYTSDDAIEFNLDEFKTLKKRTRHLADWNIDCKLKNLNKNQKCLIPKINNEASSNSLTLKGVKSFIKILTDNNKNDKITFDDETMIRVREYFNITQKDASDSDIISFYNMIMQWIIDENKSPKDTRY